MEPSNELAVFGGLLGGGNLPSSLPVGVARRRRLFGRELHAALQRLVRVEAQLVLALLHLGGVVLRLLIQGILQCRDSRVGLGREASPRRNKIHYVHSLPPPPTEEELQQIEEKMKVELWLPVPGAGPPPASSQPSVNFLRSA